MSAVSGVRSEPLTSTLLVGTALGLMFAAGDLSPAAAQTNTEVLPPVAVDGTRTQESYRTDFSASPKATAPLLDTPKTVTVIPRQLIEDRASLSLQDVLRTTPGITLGAGEGGVPATDRPSIRGFDATTDTFVDGVRDLSSQNREIFNLESVEISKGPNSTFAGRGSTGGSINLISKTPKAENFINGAVTIGTDKTRRATIDGNYQVGDQIAIRLNAMGHEQDVAGRDEVNLSRWGFAPSVQFGLTTPTRVTLSVYHMQTNDLPDYGIPYDPRTGHPANVSTSNFYGLTNRDFSRINTTIATAKIEHDISSNMTIRNVTRFGVSENDFLVTNPDDSAGNVAGTTVAPTVPGGYVWRNIKSRNSDTKAFINQTDLYGNFDVANMKNTYSVGIEFSREQVRNRGYLVNTATGLPIGPRAGVGCDSTNVGAGSNYNCTDLYNPNPNDPWTGSIGPAASGTHTVTLTKAVYGFNTIQLNDQFSVNFGLRYDMYDTDQEPFPRTAASPERSNHDNFLNYSVGGVYKPLPNGSIYVSYGTSSNPSGEGGGDGSSTLSATTDLLKAEKNRSLEVGTKWDLMNQRLAVSGALFRIEKTNARVASSTVAGAQMSLDGEQRVQGFEVGVSGNITREWKVFGGYTYLDSEITDPGPLASNAATKGNQLPNTPTHSGSIWSTYSFLRDFQIGGGASYVGPRNGNTTGTREVPGYWRFDAMGSYRFNEHVAFQLNVLNLFDKDYFDKPYTSHFATVGAGRTALLTTSFKF